MWVVKIGGSLSTEGALLHWLSNLARLGAGRVVIVPGGGGLADEVRRLQVHWQFDDLPAHNMAVLAMAQNAYLMQALEPALTLVKAESEIPRVLRRGKAVIWLPLDQLRQAPDDTTNWETTSDSLALTLAQRLNAERLLVVKASSAVEGPLSALVQDGLLDLSFARRAQGTAFPIDVLHVGQWATAEALLLGQTPALRA